MIMAKAKRKHRFMIGYPADVNCIYGKNGWANPMTKSQALRYQKDMFCEGAIIYELVEIEENVQ